MTLADSIASIRAQSATVASLIARRDPRHTDAHLERLIAAEFTELSRRRATHRALARPAARAGEVAREAVEVGL